MKPTKTRYLVLAFLSLACFIAYVDRGCLGIAVKSIAADFKIDLNTPEGDRAVGQILGAFFIGYVIFQVPAGWLGQRFGSRWCLTACCLIWSLCTAGSGLSGGFYSLFLMRFLMGIAEAGIVPCCNQSLAQWFPRSQRGWTTGVLGGFMQLGGVAGGVITSELLGFMSWRWIFFAYAVPGVFWALLFVWWFRNRPAEHAGVNEAELALIDSAPLSVPRPMPWLKLFTTPAVWWLSGQQFFRGASQSFYITWMATYLMMRHNVPESRTGYFVGFAFIGLFIGGLSGGFLTDYLLRRTGSLFWARQFLAILTLTLGGFAMLLAGRMSDPWSFSMVLLAGTIIAGVTGPTAAAATIDLGGKFVAPTFSYVNMAGNLGAALFPVVAPEVLAWTDQSWDAVLYFSAGLNLLAAVCWIFFSNTAVIESEPEP